MSGDEKLCIDFRFTGRLNMVCGRKSEVKKDNWVFGPSLC